MITLWCRSQTDI